MIETKETIINQAQDMCGNTSQDIETKLEDHINILYDRICKVAVPSMLIKQKTFTLTANKREKSLGGDVLDILTVYDTTNGYKLHEKSLERIEQEGVDTTLDTGDPYYYMDIGEHFVDLENSSSGVINVTSSSAADITPHILRIRGLSGGVMVTENLTINGVASVGGAISWDANQKLVISVGTNDNSYRNISGVLTVTRGSETLSIISQNATATLYRWVSLYPIPDSGAASNSYRLTYVQRPYRLANDNDVPIFDCTDALINGLVAYALREDGDEQGSQIFDAKFSMAVAELKAHYRKKANLLEQFCPDTTSCNSWQDRIGETY